MSRPMRVIVVEDEPRLRAMLVRAVTEMGMSAAGAASAPEAIRGVLAGGADLIVLDLQLPGMTGMELLTELRQHNAGRRLGVVVLTAFGDFDAARQAIHLDVAEFLTKPCSLGDLEKALDKARQRLPVTPPTPLGDVDAATIDGRPPREPEASESHAKPSASTGQEASPADLSLDQVERQAILKALQRHHGHRANAAADLGISVRTLYYRLSQYGLDREG